MTTEIHRAAYLAVVEGMPGSVFISHEDVDTPEWQKLHIQMPLPFVFDGCPTCGDPRKVVGLTVKCRDWHDICRCGQPYDKPKGEGCRRRKHPKVLS